MPIHAAARGGRCGAPSQSAAAADATADSVSATDPNAWQTLTITESTPGAVVYYTVDGTIPTHASQAYLGPIQVRTNNETIRAIADYPGTCSDSTAALATYTLTLPDAGSAVASAISQQKRRLQKSWKPNSRPARWWWSSRQ